MFLAHEAERPVAFFANGIGDAFINLPALRALAALFRGKLSLICENHAYNLCFSELALKEVIRIRTSHQRGDRLFCADELAAAIGRCDLFLSLVPWHSASMTRLLDYLAPSVSVGFFPQFSVSLPRDYGKHSADLAFGIPRVLQASMSIEDFSGPPKFESTVEREVGEICASLPASWRRLAVHVDTVPEKTWPIGRFVSVLDQFLDRHRDFIAFVVGHESQPIDKGNSGSRVFNTCGLSLAASCCLVSHADLFLGIDSCMLHVADLCRVPGVGLFGPTSSHEFGFRFGRHRHVCGSEKMQDIPVRGVSDALESLWSEVEGV